MSLAANFHRSELGDESRLRHLFSAAVWSGSVMPGSPYQPMFLIGLTQAGI